MPIELLNTTMHSGARHFMDLPTDVIGWSSLYRYLGKLKGVKMTGFLTDYVTEFWMDFSLRGYNFSVNNQMGEYWFFAENAECPEEILSEIAQHCGKFLEK